MGDITYRDQAVRGLVARATSKRYPGQRSYYLYYRENGKERRPKLGDCHVITLAQAREKAKNILAAVQLGLKVPRSGITVSAFWRSEIDPALRRLKGASEYRRLFAKVIAPEFGARRVSAITYSDVAEWHARLNETPYQANRALAVLSMMLGEAERQDIRPGNSNPCRLVRRHREASRKRHATAEELARLGAALRLYLAAGSTRANALFLLLLLLTGMRPGELEGAKREWLHGNVLRLPDSKTGSRDVHLSAEALDALATWGVPDSVYVVATTKPDALWRRIRKEAGCPDLRMYDLRRTFATVGMAETGNVGVIGEMLGHKQAQTTKVYARLWNAGAETAAGQVGTKLVSLLGLAAVSPTGFSETGPGLGQSSQPSGR